MVDKTDPYADLAAEEAAAKAAVSGAPPAGVNPYKPGTEEADWYARQPQPTAQTLTVRPLSGSFDPMTGAPIGGQDPYADLPPGGFTPPQPAPKEVYRGSVLPLTRDTSGNIHFTPMTAGPIGAMYEGAQLPGRVLSGEVKVDPSNPAFMGQVLNTAGVFNPANPMIRSGSGVIPGVRMAPREVAAGENVREGLNVLGFGPGKIKPQTPSEEALHAVGSGQHAAFKGMDIPYNPAYMGVLSQQIEQKLVDAGVHPQHAPGLYETIRGLRDYTPRSGDPSDIISLSPSNLMAIRDSIKNHFDAGPHPSNNQHGVGVAYRAFDDFLERPPAEAILGRAPTGSRTVGPVGPASNLENEIAAAAGADIFKRGRANLSAMHRSEDIGAIDEAAGLRNASANSGNNLGNSLRSRVTSMLLSPRRMVGFNDAEEAALRAVPQGTTTRNVGRTTANILGGGGGIGTQAVGWGTGALADYLGAGPLASTAVGLGVPAFGMWLKNRVGQSTADALADVSTLTRQRSPLYRETPFKERAIDPSITLSPRDRLARAMNRQLVGGGQGVPIPTDPYGNQVRPAWEEAP